MRLLRLTFRDITRFNRLVEIDFEALGEGVIAVCGHNGSGKSSCSELSGPGALFGEMPTRKPPRLAEWMTSKDAFLHLDFAFGAHVYRIEHTPKSSALFEDGVIVNENRLRRTFAEAIAERFGPSEVFYSSVFAQQGGAGAFTTMTQGQRKEILRHHFGLHRLQAIADVAKAGRIACDPEGHVRAAKAALATKDALDAARASQAEAASAVQAALADLKVARAEVAERMAVLEIAPAVQRFRAVEKRLAELQAQLENQRARIKPLPPPAEAKRDLKVEADKAAKRAELQGALHGLRVELEAAETDATRGEAFADHAANAPCVGHRDRLEHRCPLLKAARDGSLLGIRDDGERVGALIEETEAYLVEIGEPQVEAAERALTNAEHNEKFRLGANFLKDQIAELRTEERALRAALPEVIPEGSLLAEANAAVRRQESAENAYARAVTTAATATQIAKQAEDEAAEAEHARRLAKKRAADAPAYSLLAKAFGPNGIQAHEVDYKAPKLEAYANELLQAGWPDRFRVELRTQRLRKGGSPGADLIEAMDVVVHDALRGRTGTAESVSGGERVLIDEALRTAQAIIATEGGGWSARMQTAWRDETPAVLYGEVARRHVAMLAKARTLGGFHQVLFVGGPIAAEVADAVITIREEDGEVTCTRR